MELACGVRDVTGMAAKGEKKWYVEFHGVVSLMAKTEAGAITKAQSMIRREPTHLNAYASRQRL